MRGFRGSASGADNSGRAKARTDANGTTFYHSDAGGNITAMTDGNGNVVARYLYDPFGNLLAKTGTMADVNRYRFSSKEVHPNSGLYYYGFRFYEPNLQRWLNEDPIGETGGMNLFGFVGNSPMIFVDMFGLDSEPNLKNLKDDDDLADTEANDAFKRMREQGEKERAGFVCTAKTAAELLPQNDISGLATGESLSGEKTSRVKAGLGLAAGVLGKGKKCLSLLGDWWKARKAKKAFEIAQKGGRHAGFLKNYANKTPDQLRNGIRSLEELIAEHRAKINDPEKYIPNFKQLDPRQQKALLERQWPGDIQRQQEQMEILKGLLGGN